MERSTQSRVVSRRPWGWRVLGMLATLALAGCFTVPTKKVTVYQNEGFESDETYSRLFDASPAAACEAARRALLGQGYLMSKVTADAISATKSFQPDGDVHVQIVFNVVCVPEGKAAKVATAYVNAIQDRYALKKTSNSASLGVSALGSVSIPLSSNDDSLVKVASETIPAGQFYDRFFALMQRNLDEQVKED